jgi:hypothetical protein
LLSFLLLFQYQNAFKSKKLLNWELPSVYQAVRYFDILKLLMFPACMFSIDSSWPVGLEGFVGGFGYIINISILL